MRSAHEQSDLAGGSRLDCSSTGPLTRRPVDTLRRAYWNLHKGCVSVQAMVDGPNGPRWLVVDHVDELRLVNVEFKVYEAGRQHVLDTGSKTVHAYVIGMLAENVEVIPSATVPVIYNPYRFDSFVRAADYSPISSARLAVISNKRIEVIEDHPENWGG